MSATLRILYLSWSILPSERANAVQVVRMVNALAAQGAAVALVARSARGDRRDPAAIAAAAGLDPAVRLVLLPAARLAAGLAILWHARRGWPDGNTDGGQGGVTLDAIYARVLPVFLMRLPAARRVLELHEPPRANWRLKPRVFDLAVGRGGLTDLVYISDGLARIVEREHAEALARGGVRRRVLHSGGASPGPERAPPAVRAVARGADDPTGKANGAAPFALAYAGRSDKLDPEIIQGIAAAHPGIAIRLYGPAGPEPARLEGVPGVERCGWVDPVALPERLAQAHILLAPYGAMPAADWFSPVKLFDYAAVGRPVLASDLPAIRDIFPDGEIGWLLPPGDAAAWADAVARLRACPALCRRMGAAARAFAARHAMPARARAVLAMLRDAGSEAPDPRA